MTLLPTDHSTTRQTSPGKYYPCGATLTPDGVNFALFSEYATEVFLLLFDRPEDPPTDSIRMEQKTRHVWHILVHGTGPGQLYGYKVRGPYLPSQGLRFNEHKLLVCPYAQALTGKIRNRDRILDAFDATAGKQDLVLDRRDNTLIVPKGIVVDNDFDWQEDQSPEIPFEKLVIYEAHLKGFTAHPSSGVAHPGTYLGFIEKIPYLNSLGINAVEFLPLHEFYVEDFLINNGLTNYWGYNTAAFFAPESSYAAVPGNQVQEFKTLVRELHKAGIEVILDVVYNHTGEGNEQGPTFSFKGIDNRNYYSLTGPPDEPYRYYMNHSGCGNSLRIASPHVLRLVMDSLRYWVEEMHVDGFRFDLASVLGRGEDGTFQRNAAFFMAVAQDPVLNRVKLIAEPWDTNTYQVGNFPVDWAEWNDRFRDTLRRFMRGDRGQIADLGWRLTGSADLFSLGGRSAYNSINFITCHDGFTLNDLVSYKRRHNRANKEKNNDGAWDNNSSNYGVEGETDDPHVLLMRRRLVKNFLCALFFSTGTPLLLAGDEVLRTQCGNNNAYCQDNETSWFNWEDVERNSDIFDFCRKAIALTRRYRVLHRKKFFDGCVTPDGVCDIVWYDQNLRHPVWSNARKHTLCCQLAEEEGGGCPSSCSLYFIFNAANRQVKVKLPRLAEGHAWRRIVDTSLLAGDDFREQENEAPLEGEGTTYVAAAQSVVVLVG
jgi:isoamylase